MQSSLGLRHKFLTKIFTLQQKRKLRIYISNTFTPGKPEGDEAERISSWELRVEGKLLDDVSKIVLF